MKPSRPIRFNKNDDLVLRKTGSGLNSSIKRVTLRTECIKQLESWHMLLERGAISQSDYDEILSLIMKYNYSGLNVTIIMKINVICETKLE